MQRGVRWLSRAVPVLHWVFRPNLKTEITYKFLGKIMDAISNLDGSVGVSSAFEFISDSCNGMKFFVPNCQGRKHYYGCTNVWHIASLTSHMIMVNLEDSSWSSSKPYSWEKPSNTGMLWKMFDILCEKKYTAKLYCNSYWSSAIQILLRLSCLSLLLRTYHLLSFTKHVGPWSNWAR